ncbi:MAG: four helix bundle protein [Terriglobales bacterium]
MLRIGVDDLTSFRHEHRMAGHGIPVSKGVMARSYRELVVWQKAKALAVHTYAATANFPRAETYGLTSQIRRSSVSVASNIAEGQGRLTRGEFRHFLGQARGSLLEAETQLAIARDLGFLEQNAFASLDEESYRVLGLLDRLLSSLQRMPA